MEKFLSLRVSQEREFISIDQQQLIDDMLLKFGMMNCNEIATPAEVEKNCSNQEEVLLDPQVPFRALIGSLNYIANVSRPDILFAVNKLARKLEKPTTEDWIKGKRILRYLQGTRTYKIKYKRRSGMDLKLYRNADYAGSEDKKSTSGFIAL